MAHLHPDTRSLLQIMASGAVKMGQLPKHVAFIMDGNRRYAKSKGVEIKVGHRAGLIKAKEISRWAHELQIQEITLYAFSIENFKRTQQQVDDIMDLLYEYCVEILTKLASYSEFDTCIQFIGNWDLIPARLKPNMAKIMLETRHMKGLKINMAVAYTGRNGIEQSMKNIQDGLRDGQLLPQDVSEHLMDEAKNLLPMTPVDMLIRTGGDSRISDFMMWESSQAYIHFMDSSWPEFSFWEVWDATMKYQSFRRNATILPPPKEALMVEQKDRADKFLEHIREIKWNGLRRFAKKSDTIVAEDTVEESLFRETIKKLLVIA